jgi:hypothetical protein
MSNKYLSDEIYSTANAIINRNELTRVKEISDRMSQNSPCSPVATGINSLFNYASGGGERRSG